MILSKEHFTHLILAFQIVQFFHGWMSVAPVHYTPYHFACDTADCDMAVAGLRHHLWRVGSTCCNYTYCFGPSQSALGFFMSCVHNSVMVFNTMGIFLEGYRILLEDQEEEENGGESRNFVWYCVMINPFWWH